MSIAQEGPSPVLLGTADRFTRVFAQLMGGRLERHALTVSGGEFGLLMVLAERGEPMSSREIQEAMRIGAGGVANLLKSLDRKGYVHKERSQGDGRANAVSITEAGLDALEERFGQVRRTVLAYMERIGPEESLAFTDTLEKILEISLDMGLSE